MQVSGWWKEARVPGENPRLHEENMHRKASAGIRTSNPLAVMNGANHHTTAQPPRFDQFFYFWCFVTVNMITHSFELTFLKHHSRAANIDQQLPPPAR